MRRRASRTGVRLTEYLRRDLLLAQHRARRELAGDDRLLERERDLVGLGPSAFHAVKVYGR